MLGEREVTLLAGVAVQLHQCGLDLGVAGDAVFLPWAEASIDEVDEGQCEIQQVGATCGAGEGDAGLQPVTEHVQLMGPVQLGELPLRVHALDPGVQVAAGILHAGDESDHLVEPGVMRAGAGAADLPGDRFDDLVQVRVGEDEAPVGSLGLAEQPAEVVEHAGGLQLCDAVRDGLGGVELLPGAEGPVRVQGHRGQVQRMQPRREADDRQGGGRTDRGRGLIEHAALLGE